MFLLDFRIWWYISYSINKIENYTSSWKQIKLFGISIKF